MLASKTLEHWAEIKNSESDHLQEAQTQSQIQLDQIVHNIEELWIQINDSYAYLWRHSHTYRAVARLLHLELEVFNEIFHEGVLDESEKDRLVKQIEVKIRKLQNGGFKHFMKIKFNNNESEEMMKNSLLTQPFIQRKIKDRHIKEIFEKLTLQRYKEGDYVIKQGDKATIVFITPPKSFGDVFINERFLWHSVSGEIFTWDFLCEQKFSFSMKAKTNLHAYHITREMLDLIWRDLTDDKRYLYYQQL